MLRFQMAASHKVCCNCVLAGPGAEWKVMGCCSSGGRCGLLRAQLKVRPFQSCGHPCRGRGSWASGCDFTVHKGQLKLFALHSSGFNIISQLVRPPR